MPDLQLTSQFHSDPRVARCGNSAVGAWVRMANWSIQWLENDAPQPVLKSSRRMFGITPNIASTLIAAGLLTESADGRSWIIQGRGELWRPALAARARIPVHVRAAVYARDGYRCQKCGTGEELSLDHIIAWSRGGPDTVDNLQTLCRPCNSAKGDRDEAN